MDKSACQFKIEQLKQKVKKDNKPSSLFSECIEALGEDIRIYSLDESVRIVAHLVVAFPFTNWGRVDWNEIKNKKSIKNLRELSEGSTIDLNMGYYVIWDEMNLPVIEAKLKDIIERQDEVTAVGFDTWLINFEMKTIIEVHHEGEIFIGTVNK